MTVGGLATILEESGLPCILGSSSRSLGSETTIALVLTENARLYMLFNFKTAFGQ